MPGVTTAAALALRGRERAAVAGGVGDAGARPGVQRRAVAVLPAGKRGGGRRELLRRDLGRRLELDLGATLLPVEVVPDPAVDEPHVLEVADPAPDGLVVAIARLERITSHIPCRMDVGEACDQLAHAGHHGAAVPAGGGQAPQIPELGVGGLERADIVQPPSGQLAAGDPSGADAGEEREEMHRVHGVGHWRRGDVRHRAKLARAPQAAPLRRIDALGREGVRRGPASFCRGGDCHRQRGRRSRRQSGIARPRSGAPRQASAIATRCGSVRAGGTVPKYVFALREVVLFASGGL